MPFGSRLADANYAQTCASFTDTLATVPTLDRASSLTGVRSGATICAAVVNTPALAPPTEPTVSLPLVSSPALVVQVQDGAASSTYRRDPQLPRASVASRLASRLTEISASLWGVLLPRQVLASRIADRLLPEVAPEEFLPQQVVMAPVDIPAGMSSRDVSSPALVKYWKVRPLTILESGFFVLMAHVVQTPDLAVRVRRCLISVAL